MHTSADKDARDVCTHVISYYQLIHHLLSILINLCHHALIKAHEVRA